MSKIEQSYESLRETEQAPYIQYDKKDIKPDIIQQKKWDFIYKVISFTLLIVIYLSSFYLGTINKIVEKKAQVELEIQDNEPLLKKIKVLTNNANYDTMNINKFLLETLFFTGDKNYEVINKLKLFFEDPKVMANLGDFQMREIFLSADTSAKNSTRDKDTVGLKKVGIKLRGSYKSYKDIESIVNFLNNMQPIVVTEELNLNKGNSMDMTGYVYILDKEFIQYNYNERYTQVNKLLRLKEELDKNTQLLQKLLQDKDLGLEEFGITKIYNCSQYEKLLEKQDLVKDEQIEMCYDLENLVKEQEVELDTTFNLLLQKSK